MGSQGTQIQVLTTEAEWDRLAERWDELLLETSGGTALQRFAFLRAWWRHFSHGKTLYLITACRDGKVIGIAPLQMAKRSIFGFQYRVLEFMGMPDELDRPRFLLADDNVATLNLILEAISDNDGDWDLVQLDEVEEGHWQFGQVVNWAKAKRFWFGERPLHPVPYLRKEADWQAYLGAKSRRFPKRLAELERKARRVHTLSYKTAQGGKDMEPLIDVFFVVERESWKYAAGLDIGVDRDYRAFYRDLLRADSPALRGHAIVQYFDDRPSAATLGISSGNTYYSLQIAHDRRFDAYSPGTLLEAYELEWFFGDPALRIYDFLGGDGSNKRRWTGTAIDTVSFFVARSGFRPWIARNHLFHIRDALTRSRDWKHPYAGSPD